MALTYAVYAGFEFANGCEGTTPKTGNVYTYHSGASSHLGYYGLELSEAGAGLNDYFTMQGFTYADYTMITFYVKFTEMAPAPAIPFLHVFDYGGNTHFTLELKTNGDISLKDANGVERGTYSGGSADTWYRYHVYWKRHATTGRVTVWRNYTVGGAASTEIFKIMGTGEDQNFEGGTTGPTYVQVRGQTGVSTVPSTVIIGAAAVFTEAEMGTNEANLNEGIGRRQWGVPYYYSVGHETTTSDFGSNLTYGTPDFNWARMNDVPFNTTERAGFNTDFATSGRKRCDSATGSRRGPYQGVRIDYADRGEVLAASWAFRAYNGTVTAQYGKGDDSPSETYTTSGSFNLRSGIQCHHRAATDGLVPKPENEEYALVGIGTDGTVNTSMATAVACVLYVPPWQKKVHNGTLVGSIEHREIVAG